MATHRPTIVFLAIGLPMVVAATSAIARTWRVERDGSGDFQVLQYAIDAAAAGDTILIGPGRYDEFFDVVGPAWTRPAVAWINKDDLTIIGADRDSTILGREVYYDPGLDAMIVGCAGDYRCEIRGVTIEGAYNGIYWWQAELELSDCILRNCEYGVEALQCGPVHITYASIECRGGGLSDGIISYFAEGPLEVTACEFTGFGTGVSVIGSEAVISNSDFSCRSGIGADSGAHVQVTGCTMGDGLALGVAVRGFALVEAANCEFHAAGKVVAAYSDGIFRGSESVFVGGSLYGIAIWIASRAEVTIHDCHILPEGEFAVRIEGFSGVLIEQDLTNNYWGTTDTDQIDAWIWDQHDDPAIHSVVNYLPIADGPVQTESTTWGAVKSLFR